MGARTGKNHCYPAVIQSQPETVANTTMSFVSAKLNLPPRGVYDRRLRRTGGRWAGTELIETAFANALHFWKSR
jgi:hypothetical protein